jgi:hypothetical protein
MTHPWSCSTPSSPVLIRRSVMTPADARIIGSRLGTTGNQRKLSIAWLSLRPGCHCDLAVIARSRVATRQSDPQQVRLQITSTSAERSNQHIGVEHNPEHLRYHDPSSTRGIMNAVARFGAPVEFRAPAASPPKKEPHQRPTRRRWVIEPGRSDIRRSGCLPRIGSPQGGGIWRI